jgi:hypothetical protein
VSEISRDWGHHVVVKDAQVLIKRRGFIFQPMEEAVKI